MLYIYTLFGICASLSNEYLKRQHLNVLNKYTHEQNFSPKPVTPKTVSLENAKKPHCSWVVMQS